MNGINICIVDDQVLFRQGIASLLNNVDGFNLLFEAGDGQELLSKLEESPVRPHIALVDVEMPVMDGIELNNRLQQQYPDVKTIVLSVHTSPRLISRMIHSGACGYLLKNCGKEEMVAAIQATYTHGFYINAQALKAMQQAPLQDKGYKNSNGIDIELSAREKEVLQLICLELTNVEIAERLFVSPRTVDGHRNNLLAKTGCRNTAGLVLFAVRHHIVEIPF